MGTLSRVTNGRHRQALATVFCVFWLNLCLLTLGRKIAEVGEMASECARWREGVFLSVCVLSCFFGVLLVVQGARGNTFACDKW